MPKINCMIDHETLGQRFDAPILTIGACFFDIETGEIGKHFYTAIDPNDAFKWGRPNGDTFKWWMGQSDAARQAAIRGTDTMEAALKGLTDFYRQQPKAPIYGNGPTFDITILEHAYWQVNRSAAPWAFWNVRDCRTMKELGEMLGYKVPALEGTAHNALDDAKHQAKWVSAIYQLIAKQQGGAASFSVDDEI